ncbi:MAG: hypothetical protein EXR81_01130 [Gammaproteobacteria bacterium]|nr:hypothetical protein [Gammaproteobacteria bacterium]
MINPFFIGYNMKKIAVFLLILFSSFFSIANAAKNADTSEDGISIIRSFNGTEDMNGFAIGLKSYWGNIFTFKNNWYITGVWDANLAYWHSEKVKNTHYSNITMLTLTPTFRYQRLQPYENTIAPHIDLGYGIGLMNQEQFSNNKLGGYATFELTAGFGIQFGSQAQYDLAYHYLTYNNASQFKNDDGLFINEIEFTYNF